MLSKAFYRSTSIKYTLQRLNLVNHSEYPLILVIINGVYSQEDEVLNVWADTKIICFMNLISQVYRPYEKHCS
jgi:hypothetical protein